MDKPNPWSDFIVEINDVKKHLVKIDIFPLELNSLILEYYHPRYISLMYDFGKFEKAVEIAFYGEQIYVIEHKFWCEITVFNKNVLRNELDEEEVTFYRTHKKTINEVTYPHQIAVDDKYIYIFDINYGYSQTTAVFIFCKKTFNRIHCHYVGDSKDVSHIRRMAIDDEFLYILTVAPKRHRVCMFRKSDWGLERRWGSRGKADGQFENANSLIVTKDCVYLGDDGNNRIQVFDKFGNFIRKFASGSYNKLRADPYNLYLIKKSHLYITILDKFDGTTIRQFGIGDFIDIAFDDKYAYVLRREADKSYCVTIFAL